MHEASEQCLGKENNSVYATHFRESAKVNEQKRDRKFHPQKRKKSPIEPHVGEVL